LWHFAEICGNKLEDNMVTMNHQNPWHEFPHDIYEKHMGHENVRQLEMLSRIVGEQLGLVSKPVIAVLGITDGNGLDNVQEGQYEKIIGMDINAEYLEICRQRYGYLPKLELYQIDLMTERDRATEILKQADLIIANLVVKHIHLNNLIDIVSKLVQPVISVVVQFDPDGCEVSKSGFESEFDEIQKHGEDCDELSLTTAMNDSWYALNLRTEYILPNEKVFIRLDYEKCVGGNCQQK